MGVSAEDNDYKGLAYRAVGQGLHSKKLAIPGLKTAAWSDVLTQQYEVSCPTQWIGRSCPFPLPQQQLLLK